jgi:hypothetical protein
LQATLIVRADKVIAVGRFWYEAVPVNLTRAMNIVGIKPLIAAIAA